MNKKILVLVVGLLVLSITLTPFALAKPWEYPKNNDKFESYYVIHENLPVTDLEVEYKPNEENPNVQVYSWGDNIGYYNITIGDGKHYFRDVDFAYEQDCVWTAIGAPFINIGGVPMGSKSNIWRIEYKFDFSAGESEIDGTLEMLFLYNNGKISIRSLRGTGDLQNVQILATAVYGVHSGVVIGWPDIPGATD
jgi:hypothetical protein